MVLFALLGHYCYFRKRDDEDEDADTTDLERGQLRSIRPTHNLFCSYPYHRNGHPTAIRNDAIGTCCAGDKILANLVTGHHHHHLLPPSSLVIHDNSELVNGQATAAAAEKEGEAEESNGSTEVKSVDVTGPCSGTSCAVIENHLQNDDLPAPVTSGSNDEISPSLDPSEEEKQRNETEKQEEEETTSRETTSNYIEKKVPESSSSGNLSSCSISVVKQQQQEEKEEG